MDRFGAWVTLAAFISGTVAALWLLPFAHGVPQLLAITVLFSCWNGCGVITQTYIADTLPAEMQGTGLGTLKAGWMTVGATSPLLIGISRTTTSSTKDSCFWPSSEASASSSRSGRLSANGNRRT